MTIPALESVVLEPHNTHKSSVIWLHGLGADGHDFEALVPELQIPEHLGIRFIFPHAPFMPVTVNGGMAARAWFDLYSLDNNFREDEVGIVQMAQAVGALVQQELDRGIASTRILLAGFSQGGAMVFHTALRYGQPLAGVMALSTYLPLIDRLAKDASPVNRSIPIFFAHGTHDEVIPLRIAEISKRCLLDLGYLVQWHAFPMGHAVCNEELLAMRSWIVDRLMP